MRIAENQQAAGSAYAAPDPRELKANTNPAGLPWGSVPLDQAVEAGQARENQPQQTNREAR